MTLRAALYARFSTGNQSPLSVPAQLALCREHAGRLGVVVVDEFSDAGISGWATANRPGYNDLMAAAQGGRFDLVIAEHTDRLSRSGGGGWDTYEDLKALGIPINTVNQGVVTAMHIGLGSTVSVMQLEEGAHKTRRGLREVVKQGRSGGGLSYGYRIQRAYDGRGEPIRGLREIDPEKAAVVLRIFGEYAAGRSPQAIAAGLNASGVPGPSGGAWNASTIAGNAKRGNGVLHNELYRGVIVWGRHTWSKDRRSGLRRARAGAEGGVVRKDAPELRVVAEPLWLAVRARHAEAAHAATGGRPEGARRPRRLLSGLIRCGVCGGQMNLSGPNGALRCHNRVERGPAACANGRSPAYAGVEARVLASIQDNLLHPEVIEAAVAEFHTETARRRRGRSSARAGLLKEQAEVGRRADRLVDQVAEGHISGAAVRDRLAQLEARRAELEQLLAAEAADADVIALHPASAGMYRKLVEDLLAAIETPELLEAAQAKAAIRALVSEVRITPLPQFGQYLIDLTGDLAPMLATNKDPPGGTEGVDVRVTVGAGTRVTCWPKVSLPVRLRA